MLRIAKRIVIVIALLLITIIVGVLYVPYTTQYIIQCAAAQYLGHTLTVKSYRFNGSSLFLAGTFEDNSSIELSATRLLTPYRRIKITTGTNVAFFSRVSKSKLPNIALEATIFWTQDRLQLDARLLDGSLKAEMDTDSHIYHYMLEHADIGRFLADQHLPAYASGHINAVGRGSAGTHSGDITSYNIKLLEPLTSSIRLPALKAPAALDASVMYTYENDHVTGEISADTEVYTLFFDHTEYSLEQHSIQSNYRIATRSNRPFNLSGDNALKGKLTYQDDNLDVEMTASTMQEPLYVHYQPGFIKVISNNMPINAITSIFNLPNTVYGHFRVDAAADLNKTRPKVTLNAAADDVTLNAELSEEYNLTRPAALKLTASSEASSQYRADLYLHTVDNAVKGNMHLDYDVSTHTAVLEGRFDRLTLPWYRGRDIALHATAEPEKRQLSRAHINTPFESISIPKLIVKDGIRAEVDFSVRRLDRFVRGADSALTLEGHGDILKKGDHADFNVTTETFGRFAIALDQASKHIDAEAVPVRQLFSLLGRPALLDGNLTLKAAFENGRYSTAFRSPKLIPSSELNGTLRTSPLEGNITLSGRGDRFVGDAALRTEADVLELESFEIDPAEQQFVGRYRLDVKDSARSMLLIPEAWIGRTLTLEGKADVTPQRQAVSLQSDRLMLAPELHRYFDKNATESMPVSVDMNASHEHGRVALSASVASDPVSFLPLQLTYLTDTAFLTLQTHLYTKRFPGDSVVRSHAVLGRKTLLKDANVSLKTASFDLNVSHIYIGSPADNYGADFSLSPASSDRFGPHAVIRGQVRSRPEFRARLSSDGFDGNLSAVMNDDMLIVHASHLSLPQWLHLFKPKTRVKAGRLDADIILDAPALLEGNLSRLDGGIDIRMHNVRIDGIAADPYLETLRNTQDLSLFQGSLLELPIIRSVRTLPGDLLDRQAVETEITNGRLAVSVSDGTAVCEDCAAATPLHRIAAAGNVDLPSQRYDAFYVALLKPDGCPYFIQNVYGSLSDPKVNLAESGIKVIGGAVVSTISNVTEAAEWLTGIVFEIGSATGKVIRYVPVAGKPADDALKNVTGTLHGTVKRVSGCTPFYLGTVPHPVKKP